MKVFVFLLAFGLVVASAARFEEDDLTDLGFDVEEGGKSLGDRIREGLQSALERVKARAEKNKVIAQEFAERLNALGKKIAEIGKDVTAKSFKKIREIRIELTDVARSILRKLRGNKERRSSVEDELEDLFKQIRAEIHTPEGMKEVRDHISRMKTTHPTLQLVKSFIEAADDKELREIMDALFGDVVFYKARYDTKLEKLFQRVAELIRTDEGFEALYNHFLHLETNHPLLKRLHLIFLAVDKEDVRDILEDLISAFEH